MFVLFLENFKETTVFQISDEVESQILIAPYFIERCSRSGLYRGIANLQAIFCLVLNLCTVSVLQKYSEKVMGSFSWQNLCMNIATS